MREQKTPDVHVARSRGKAKRTRSQAVFLRSYIMQSSRPSRFNPLPRSSKNPDALLTASLSLSPRNRGSHPDRWIGRRALVSISIEIQGRPIFLRPSMTESDRLYIDIYMDCNGSLLSSLMISLETIEFFLNRLPVLRQLEGERIRFWNVFFKVISKMRRKRRSTENKVRVSHIFFFFETIKASDFIRKTKGSDLAGAWI